MKFYLFLKSLVWTAILALASVVAMIVSAYLGQELWVFTFGFTAVVFAALTSRRN